MYSPVKGYPIFLFIFIFILLVLGDRDENNRKIEIDVVENRVKVELQQVGEWEKTWKDRVFCE